MAASPNERSPGLLLTDAEVEEFRVLARQHAGAELTVDEGRVLSGQLLRALATVRDVALGEPRAPASPVDNLTLPESDGSGINSNSSFI